MRYIDFSLIDQNDPDVKEWIKRARRRYRTLSSKATHQERAQYLARSNFWTEFKPILIKYYGNLCWYSECDLTGAYGDIDHFRPKNRSMDENDNPILADGYWWLAYDYLNYRLSCDICNKAYREGGKKDRFPLKPGTSPALMPNSDDVPLLLDPCVFQDVELIDCNETGEIVSLSDNDYDEKRIEVSKRLYNWNYFNTARREIRTKCKTALEMFEWMYELAPDKMTSAIKQIHDLADSQTPYSSFAKHYISEKIAGKPYEDVIRQIL